MNLVAVHLIGPHIDSIRNLVASFSREESCSPKVIDVIRHEELRATKSIHAARLQLQQEREHENQHYISIGSLIDLIQLFRSENQASSPIEVSNNDPPKSLLRPFVNDLNEAGLVLDRYRQSLNILMGSNITNAKADEIDRYISILHQLSIPFYHMQDPDVSIQVNTLKLAITNGKLPSPIASLSFYEHLSSKKKKKDKGNQLDLFYDTLNLPFYLKHNKDSSASVMGVKSLFIGETELRQTIEHPVKGRSSRFLQRRGQTDDLFLVEFERSIPGSIVLRILQNGVHIQGCIYSFLGCSSSGLKKRKAYVIRGSHQVANNEREKYGSFSSLKDASKQISRFSLMLTNVVMTDVQPTCVKCEIDVEANKLCFTDGCGTISSDLATALIRQSRKSLSRQYEEKFNPSVFQIRMNGVKGIVVLDSSLPKGTMVVRPSMKKFESTLFPEICICDYSRPFSFGHLNR